MKSTQIHLDKVGKRKVSTVLIELNCGTQYYETAIWNPKERKFEVESSGIIKREHADECHTKAVRLAGIREGLNG
jgi:hypothetical protein